MVKINSTLSNETEPSFKVTFKCPECKIQKDILISQSELKRKANLTTISIPKNFMCPHSFVAFIDRNGVIRGYQKYDLEIISTSDYEPEEKELKQEVDISKKFLRLKIHLGEEIFYKCIKSVFNDITICCITNNPIVQENLRTFLFEIFGEYTPHIFITSLEEFNKDLRKQFKSREDIFIFDTTLSSVIKEPFEEGFDENNFQLEEYILDSIETNKINESMINEYLSNLILKIFHTIEEIKNKIETKKIENKKQIQKILKNITGKKFDKNVLNKILLNRYGLNVEKRFLNGFFSNF
jgi:hypothetical protein